MELQEQVATAEDLAAINQIAYGELSESQVFTFKLRIIDDNPTSNGRLYTSKWREANAENFVGVPIIYKHDISGSKEAVGYIYQTELTEDALYGRAYIPTNTTSGKEAVDKIHNGQLKNMSLHAISPNVKEHDDALHVLPSDKDRILEVSFVAVGGCASCGVVKEEYEVESDDETTALMHFAETQWAELQADYVRLAAFAFGTDIDKTSYQSVAESVTPQTLKTMVADLKRTIQERKDKPTDDAPQATDAEVEKLKDSLRTIRKAKGV